MPVGMTQRRDNERLEEWNGSVDEKVSFLEKKKKKTLSQDAEATKMKLFGSLSYNRALAFVSGTVGRPFRLLASPLRISLVSVGRVRTHDLDPIESLEPCDSRLTSTSEEVGENDVGLNET